MKYPFIQQETNNDCGLACLAMLYRYFFKRKILINDLKQNVNLTSLGISIFDLKILAQKYNLKLESYKITFSDLQQLIISTPVIMQIYSVNVGFHFIVVYKKHKNQLLIANPADIEVTWTKISDYETTFSNIIITSKPINHVKHIISKPLTIKKPLLLPRYLTFALTVIINNCLLVITFFMAQVFYKNFINQIIMNNSLDLAITLLLVFFVINMIKIIMEYILNKIYQKFTRSFALYLTNNLHENWFKNTPLQMANYSSSQLCQMYQDIDNISIMFCHNILEIIVNAMTFLLVTIVLLKINFMIFLVTLSNGIITLLIDIMVMLWKKPIFKRTLTTKLILQQQVILTKNGFEDSYFRQLHPYIKSVLQTKFNDHLQNDWKINSLKIFNNTVLNIIKNIINFITIYLAVVLIFDNKINLSQLIFITSINVYLVNFFANLGSVFIFWPDFINSQKRITTFFSLNQKIKTNNKIKILPPITKISITNCHFKLDNKTLFTNLNLTLQNTNMIVGTSGIGKTSLLMLIAHKYKLISGNIIVNDTIDLQTINPATWQKTCIYLPSNPYIFHGSVLENILSFDCTNEKLYLWKQIGIDNILQVLGLNSFYMCHDYGTNLSQGQKQIIVFCSLFFNNCQVFLLDEILSNVNNEMKITLLKLLMTFLPHTIIIYAGHDLTLKPLFANIINLQKLINKGEK